MIKEDYVSFEIAKLLNEKGFDGECDYYYSEDSREMQQLLLDELYYHNEDFIKCPTLQMAMKWLREEHQLLIGVVATPVYGKIRDEKDRNTCGLLYWHYMASGEWMNDKYNPIQKAFVVSEKSYENAVEAALKYSLENLI